MGSKKNIILLSLFCFFFLEISAQVGIGTTNPDASSVLDIESTNAGVLIPRVTLDSIGDNITILSPATSLLVYNTSTRNDVTPGFYFWRNARWNRLNDSDKVYGEIYRAELEDPLRIYNNLPIEFGSYGVRQGVTAETNHFVVITSGIYRISYDVSVRKVSGSQYTLGFYFATGYTSSNPPTSAQRVPGSYSHTRLVDGGNSNCGMNKIIHLNSGERIYLFTDSSNSGIFVMPGTANMNIELIRAD